MTNVPSEHHLNIYEDECPCLKLSWSTTPMWPSYPNYLSLSYVVCNHCVLPTAENEGHYKGWLETANQVFKL